MNEKTLRALVENGAIKKVRIVGSGARFHIELRTSERPIIAETNNGKIKTWASLDGAVIGGITGGAAGQAIGEVLDEEVLDSYGCLACGHTFNEGLVVEVEAEV